MTRCSLLNQDVPLGPDSAHSPAGVDRWFPALLRVKQLEQQLLAQRRSLICSFIQLLDLRDLNTGVHSTRLAEWALRVARELGTDERHLPDIEAAALLHDIGKVGIPDAVLQKPSRLADEEYALVKKHPEFGWCVTRVVPGMEGASLLILHHHENFDGTGYPAGLKQAAIPIGARIVSVIDAFDAMISSRPYRRGLPLNEAVRQLMQSSGTQFDPAVVQCFVRIAGPELLRVFAAAGTSISTML